MILILFAVFLLFQSSLARIINYNGIIEIKITLNTDDLVEKIKNSATNDIPKKNMRSHLPPVFYSKPSHEGDGFNLYDPTDTIIENEKKKIIQKIINRSLQGIPGVFALYKGMSNYSDNDGIIRFPNKETSKKITVIFSSASSIPFTLSHRHTPSYFLLPQNKNTEWFLLEQKEKDIFFAEWEIKKINPPKNNKIPDDAIIIFIDPQFAHFSKNQVISILSSNFILPEIIISIDPLLSTLPILFAANIFQYFKPITFDEKQSTLNHETHFTKHISENSNSEAEINRNTFL